MTYIRVVRNGTQPIFGRVPPRGEEWTAYTVQLSGPGAYRKALGLFSLLPALLWPDSSPPAIGALKVEVAAEVHLNDPHPGIPVVYCP